MRTDTALFPERQVKRLLKRKFEPLEKKAWLSSPTNHEDGLKYVNEAYADNWISTVGENINEIEKQISEKIGRNCAVALDTGTSALHMAMKIAGIKPGDRVFCSDMTFIATVNPVVYEGGIPIFIDTEYDTWNMDPAALEKAFELYPDVRVIVVTHLYGTPCKIDEIRQIADRYGAVIVEDAAESLGASYHGRQTGAFGDVSCLSFNGNKIITGSSGGMLLTDNQKAAEKARKWSAQSREAVSWYQHEEIGYNYRMSNIIAGIIRGQLPCLEKHIEQKKAIYKRYRDGLAGLPARMNPLNGEPNYWLSCLLVDPDAMCPQTINETGAQYLAEAGKSCPAEILEALDAINAEGRSIWKPMHAQPLYRENIFVTRGGADVGMDIFARGLCLPSDNKMTEEDQDRIIEVIRACFE